MGFLLLADYIPQVVGEPMEEEHHNPLNGDALQRTTHGLMVWRRADNWTAFTNGSRSWVNGPLGPQERGNDERFEWEIGNSVVTPVAAPPATPTFGEMPATSTPRPARSPTPTPTPTLVSLAVYSADPAGEWVTSASPSTKYYTSRDSVYWKSWSASNRVWFASEADLLDSYPGRIRR